MNMIKPVQAITAMAVAASFLSFTTQVSQAGSIFLRCNQSTVYSGFKFTLIKCNSGVGQLTINNTYPNIKKLNMAGNIIFYNGSLYSENNYSQSIITFPGRGKLVTNVNFNNDGAYLTIDDANITSKLVKSILLACNDGSKKLAGILFTPTCSNQAPRFIAENTTNSDKIVVYYGSRGNLKFRNSIVISPKSQHRFDLSAVAKSPNSSSQKHKFEIRN